MIKKESEFAFICWRPYQVFNSINFVFNNLHNSYNKSDLFICDSFKNAKEITDNVKKSKMFNNVYFVKHAEGKTKIHNAFNCLFNKRCIKREVSDGLNISSKQYKFIIASGWMNFFVVMANLFKNANCLFLEDGTSTYLTNEKGIRNKTYFYEYLFSMLFKKGPFVIDIKEVYVNNIKFFNNSVEGRKQLPVLINSFLLQDIHKIFNYEKNDLYRNRKFIYLACPQENSFDYSFSKEYKLLEYLDKTEKLIIREHPSETIDCFDDFNKDTENDLWELLCSDVINSDNVLLGIFSTALFTPKLLYDKEPYVIFLYRILIDSKELINKYEEIVLKLKKLYRNKAKILEPESYDDFIKNIKKIF